MTVTRTEAKWPIQFQSLLFF